ncbi:MAG: TlyA family RNA methyltransferase [bacterium]
MVNKKVPNTSGIKKIRLDQLLIDRGLAKTPHQAEALILSRQIKCEVIRLRRTAIRIPQSEIKLRPGTMVSPDISVSIIEPKCPYVSRGGLKLAGALESASGGFKIDLKNKIALDIGASTGGFTDCMLQKGVKKVYAIDTGYGHFAAKLRNDPRVVLLENTNARYLTIETLRNAECGMRNENPNELLNPQSEIINPKLDLAVIDVSFISLTKIIPAVIPLLIEDGEILALIKPQFEIPKSAIRNSKLVKHGVVLDPKLREQAVNSIIAFALNSGLQVVGTVPAVIIRPRRTRNQEYFIYLKKKLNKLNG